MEKIISAVVGCGRMGAFTSESVKKFAPPCWFPLSHIEAIQNHNELELAAICEINHDLLEKAKKKYDIKNTYTDYRELIDEIKPSLLSIATRTIERPDIIEYAVHNGVNAIHMEKPICNSVKQLNSLESLLKKYNVSCTYGTIRRYFDIYRYAKELVDSGEYGDLQQIQVNLGTGQLFWTHPHSVDLILFFAGDRKLKYVQSYLSNCVTEKNSFVIESDPLIESANIYFDDGVVGTIGLGGGMDVVLSCAHGTVTVEADGSRISCRNPKDDEPYYKKEGEVHEDNNNVPQGTYSAISYLVNHLNDESKYDIKNCEYIFEGQRILFLFVQSHMNKSKLISPDELNPNIKIMAKTGERYA